MSVKASLLIHLERHAEPLELVHGASDVESLAFEIGSMGFQEIDRAQAATVAASVSGAIRLEPSLEQICSRFLGRMPAQVGK